MTQDPYEAIGSQLRVNHPVQPKTQVEKWREEIDSNCDYMDNCCFSKEERVATYLNGGLCGECKKRSDKIEQLMELISQHHEKNKTYLKPYPVGEFAEDLPPLCSNETCKVVKVTLLDKIKRYFK
jgi:hypothetical protein